MVEGKTIPEVKEAIEARLKEILTNPKAFVALGQSRGLQQVRGQHIVTPDGKVRLGLYGSVYVAGLTVPQAKLAIEQHLSQYLHKPEISVDILAYNSKVYYVIFDGAGNGQQILRLPVTGNDTVLDALSQTGGLTPVSSQQNIWVARPGPAGSACDQVLPVDWPAISQRGRTETNYQLLPGDRVFVQSQSLVKTDVFLAKLISPIERVFGIVLLGNTTYQGFRFTNNGNGTTTR
jgi:protein involved in polysaccharide export with SLBB domain